jgi:iron complex transport system substrate-binding protein
MSNKIYNFIFAFIFILGLSFAFIISNFDKKNEDIKSIKVKKSVKQRIITMSPGITEIAFELGLKGNIVGVSDYCVYPKEALKKEKVGDFLNPNFEKLLTLEPDTVIIQGRNDKVVEFCQKHSIELLRIDFKNLDSIFDVIEIFGKNLDREKESSELNSKIRKNLDSLKAITTKLAKPKVFISLWRKQGSLTGLFSCGKGSFMGELVELAGGQNIFSDVDQLYFDVSKESITKKAPQIIIETIPGLQLTDLQKKEFACDWNSLPMLPAVNENRIFILTEDYLQIPGPRIYLAAQLLAKIIHPETFQ